jgi:protein-L-isoaspartate(D-aspartate) O-methyltransferase
MNKPTDKARLLLQIRQEGVTDLRILAAFESVPRHMFVPEMFFEHACDDTSLPIPCGQTISQPSLVAVMTSALDIGDRMKVLEIGTGSGYQTAILAYLCRRVYTIERHRLLSLEANRRFHELGIHNISTSVNDGYKGWPAQAPFQRILVTAAAPEPPPTLLKQLANDGIMVIPIGPADKKQTLYRFRREGESFREDRLIDVRFVPLVEGDISET